MRSLGWKSTSKGLQSRTLEWTGRGVVAVVPRVTRKKARGARPTGKRSTPERSARLQSLSEKNVDREIGLSKHRLYRRFFKEVCEERESG